MPGVWARLLHIISLLFTVLGTCYSASNFSRIAQEKLKDAAEQGDEGMQSLLHWALENSSPEELGRMKEKTEGDLPPMSLEEQRELIAELLESARRFPAEAQILQASLTIAANTSEDESTRVEALIILQEFVEDYDVANDLPSLGGLQVLADALLEEGGVRIQALKVLQTAASNNIKFQLKLLEQESAAVPWLLQVVADAVYSEPCDEVLLVAAVRATASMSRNLPTSATGFMTAHIPHLDDDSIPAESLPQSIQLLFDVAVRSSSACSEETPRSQPCRVHANVAKSAMGLLADLAANDKEARTSLQGKYAVKAWIGLCEVVPSQADLMERVVQLLQNMWEPLPEQDGPKTSTIQVVPCLERIVETAGTEEGVIGSLQLLLKWVGAGDEESGHDEL